MQFTTISDTHGLHHQLQLPGGDLLIHAGDVCNRGTQEEAEILSIGLKNNPILTKFLSRVITIFF